jgi:hypothetical protein
MGPIGSVGEVTSLVLRIRLTLAAVGAVLVTLMVTVAVALSAPSSLASHVKLSWPTKW